jgi:hypothetical protein
MVVADELDVQSFRLARRHDHLGPKDVVTDIETGDVAHPASVGRPSPAASQQEQSA